MTRSRSMIPRHERVSINREFSSIDELVREYVMNISRTGVFIRSDQPLPVGMRVNLRFTVILDDIETIEGLGEVVRISHDPPGMGVVFVELEHMSERIIERLFVRDDELPDEAPAIEPTAEGDVAFSQTLAAPDDEESGS